jgi:hypothetical protein
MVTDDDECARSKQDEQNAEDDCKLCHDVKTPVCAASEYLNRAKWIWRKSAGIVVSFQ